MFRAKGCWVWKRPPPSSQYRPPLTKQCTHFIWILIKETNNKSPICSWSVFEMILMWVEDNCLSNAKTSTLWRNYKQPYSIAPTRQISIKLCVLVKSTTPKRWPYLFGNDGCIWKKRGLHLFYNECQLVASVRKYKTYIFGNLTPKRSCVLAARPSLYFQSVMHIPRLLWLRTPQGTKTKSLKI